MESAAQVIGNAVVSADKAATLWVNSLYTPFTDSVWMFFSNKWVWVVLYAFILCFLFLRLGWKKALLAVAAIVLTIVCCDQGANLFKNWICRLRPTHDPWMLSHGLHIPGDAGGLYGFFSGHAANSFGATGWVKNNYDGSVSMEIQGTEQQIDKVIIAIQRGTYVNIENMDCKTIPVVDGETTFRVK